MLKWIAQKAPCQEALLRLNERVIKPMVRDNSLVAPESHGQIMVAPELINLRLLELPGRECYLADDNQSQPSVEISSYLDKRIYGSSVIGGRYENQDKIAIFFHQGATYLVVADGVGGKTGGEFAARIAVQEIEKWIKNGLTVKEAICIAHERIKILQVLAPDKRSMGTTVIVAAVKNDEASIYNVGDSYAYFAPYAQPDVILLNQPQKISIVWHVTDQPPYQGKTMIDRIVRLSNGNSPIAYSLGGTMPEGLKTASVKLKAGDRLFLASDGLALHYQELIDRFYLADPLNVIVQQLIDQALWEKVDVGLRADNTSVVVIEYSSGC
jgi:serine/threonine protein phosphatase PrpC